MIYKTFVAALCIWIAGCTQSPGRVVADIPEASGICYHTASGTLFVVTDEGSLYRLSTEGEILKSKHLGDYDLEGIACKNDGLYLAVEGKERILVVNPHTFAIRKRIDIRRKYRGKELLKKDKKRGIEGIAFVEDTLFLVNQSDKKYPAKDASVLFSVQSPLKAKVAITRVLDTGFSDMAGLDYHDGLLYIVSDTDDLLIAYDSKKEKVRRTFELPPFAQEGVAFDDKGDIFFADDNGHVLRYKTEELGIE